LLGPPALILVTCNNTNDLLALTLRPGNAGVNTAADRLAVLAEAVAQLPAQHRRHLLVRGDSAAATHAVTGWLTEQDRTRGRVVEYSIGSSIGEAEPAAITALPTSAWTPALACPLWTLCVRSPLAPADIGRSPVNMARHRSLLESAG
jgi:Transposase DDE domain group 1